MATDEPKSSPATVSEPFSSATCFPIGTGATVVVVGATVVVVDFGAVVVVTTELVVVAGAVVVVGAAAFEHPPAKVATAARTVTAIEMPRHLFSISTLPT